MLSLSSSQAAHGPSQPQKGTALPLIPPNHSCVCVWRMNACKGLPYQSALSVHGKCYSPLWQTITYALDSWKRNFSSGMYLVAVFPLVVFWSARSTPPIVRCEWAALGVCVCIKAPSRRLVSHSAVR